MLAESRKRRLKLSRHPANAGLEAAMITLNTISLAVADESDPFVRTCPLTNRRKHAFDRARRPQMIPMFRRKIIEREQRLGAWKIADDLY
jgi:hypothetical protein